MCVCVCVYIYIYIYIYVCICISACRCTLNTHTHTLSLTHMYIHANRRHTEIQHASHKVAYVINTRTRTHTCTYTQNRRHTEIQHASQKAAFIIKNEVSAIMATLREMNISTPSAPYVPTHNAWEVAHVYTGSDGMSQPQDVMASKSIYVPRSAQIMTICTQEQHHEYMEAYDQQMMACRKGLSEAIMLQGQGQGQFQGHDHGQGQFTEYDDGSRGSTSTLQVLAQSAASLSSMSSRSSVDSMTSVSDTSQPASLTTSYASGSAASTVISGLKTLFANGQNDVKGMHKRFANGNNDVKGMHMHASGCVPHNSHQGQIIHVHHVQAHEQTYVHPTNGQTYIDSNNNGQTYAHPTNGQTYIDSNNNGQTYIDSNNNGQTYPQQNNNGQTWGTHAQAQPQAHTHGWVVMDSENQNPNLNQNQNQNQNQNVDMRGCSVEATGINGRGAHIFDAWSAAQNAVRTQCDFNAALEEFASMSMMHDMDGDGEQPPAAGNVLSDFGGGNQYTEPDVPQMGEIARIMDEQSRLLDRLRQSCSQRDDCDDECHGDGSHVQQHGHVHALFPPNGGFANGNNGQNMTQGNGQTFVNHHQSNVNGNGNGQYFVQGDDGQSFVVNGNGQNTLVLNSNVPSIVNGNGHNTEVVNSNVPSVVNGNGQNMGVNGNVPSVVHGEGSSISNTRTPGKSAHHAHSSAHGAAAAAAGQECQQQRSGAPLTDVKSICEKYLHRKASATDSHNAERVHGNSVHTPGGDHTHQSINCFSPHTLDSAGIPHVPTTPSNLLMRTPGNNNNNNNNHPTTPSNSHIRTHNAHSENRTNANNTQYDKSPGFVPRPGGSPNSYVLGSMTPVRNLLPNVEDVDERGVENARARREGLTVQSHAPVDPASAHKTSTHTLSSTPHMPAGSNNKSPVLTTPNAANHETHMYIHPSNLVVLSPGQTDPGSNMTNYASHKTNTNHMYESHKSAGTGSKNNYTAYQSNNATVYACENNATVIAGAVVNTGGDAMWDDEVLPPPKSVITENNDLRGQNNGQNVYAIRANNLFDTDHNNGHDEDAKLVDSMSSIPPPTVHRQPGKYTLGSENNYMSDDGRNGVVNMPWVNAAQQETYQTQNLTEDKRPSLKERIAEQACECAYIHTCKESERCIHAE
jgi:hypothetical protein